MICMEMAEFDFGKIAGRYDLCNHLFSFGMDRLWRRAAVRLLDLRADERALDLCCGTGEVVFALARYSAAGEITGLDVSEAMIRRAQGKQPSGGGGRIRWIAGDAVRTGLGDQSFDAITCAFGLRNIPDRLAALREMSRLLRPGGRAAIMEFSLPSNRVLRGLYWLYLRFVMPAAGALLFGSRNPLIYLAESVRAWNDEFDFPKVCEQAGLSYARGYPLTCGIVRIHLLKHKPMDKEHKIMME